jgi:hypothetical protein
MPLKKRTTLGHIVRLGQGTLRIEVVTPARQLEAVEPPSGALWREVLEREIRPLSRE